LVNARGTQITAGEAGVYGTSVALLPALDTAVSGIMLNIFAASNPGQYSVRLLRVTPSLSTVTVIPDFFVAIPAGTAGNYGVFCSTMLPLYAQAGDTFYAQVASSIGGTWLWVTATALSSGFQDPEPLSRFITYGLTVDTTAPYVRGTQINVSTIEATSSFTLLAPTRLLYVGFTHAAAALSSQGSTRLQFGMRIAGESFLPAQMTEINTVSDIAHQSLYGPYPCALRSNRQITFFIAGNSSTIDANWQFVIYGVS
jgi:hypothetical protein